MEALTITATEDLIATRRRELGSFLSTRRAHVRPESLGIAPSSRRHVMGLRREEVAAIAGISTTWYTWIEQGRPVNVSGASLLRITEALQLAPAEVDYVFALFRRPDIRSVNLHPDLPEVLRLLVETHTAAPAFVANARYDVIAWNRYTRVLLGFEPDSPEIERNIVWRMFFDPTRRKLYDDWELAARYSLARFRLSYARYQGRPEFESLVAELMKSEDFVRMWELHEVISIEDPQQLTVTHETLGHLKIAPAYASLQSPDCYLAILQCTPVDAGGNA
jgi:transcriptional regulator with XRE-family HTH domain